MRNPEKSAGYRCKTSAPRSWNRRTIAYMDVSLLRRACPSSGRTQRNYRRASRRDLRNLTRREENRSGGIGDSLPDASHEGNVGENARCNRRGIAKKLDAVLTERQLARIARTENSRTREEEEALLYRGKWARHSKAQRQAGS